MNQLLRSVARLDKRIAGQLKTLLIKQPHVAAVKTLNGEGKVAIVAVMGKMRVILNARVRAERAAMRPAWAHSAAITPRKSVPANGRHLPMDGPAGNRSEAADRGPDQHRCFPGG
ncbi:hypothetical protein XpopCFBP1817_06075 [Xanthomonas populi]|uniref:Uncharacterized protein n=1 Tax=Xanthomonas populi TaxID=53414 RepID=A0A2S7EUS1_9XANT|nr:hypothetical protein [Xanthomonas populi]PPU96878.1 hypothetical protein XpopCFBP1817_06075 [Xanthomonas populi]